MSESEHTKIPRDAARQQRPAEPAPRTGGQQAVPLFGPEFLLSLQRTVGNQEVNNLLRRYHAAQQVVVRSPSAGPPGAGLDAAPEVGLEGGPLSGDLSGRINSKRGGGSPLDDTTRTGMEAAFGLSLGDVRVHTDGEADALNKSVSARAFTTGSDIFFSAGTYAPGSSHGNQLLGHELTHVAQQRSGSGGGGSGELTVGPAGDSHEHEAETTGAAAAALLESGPPQIDTTIDAGAGGGVAAGGGTASRLIARRAVALLQRQAAKAGSVKTNFTLKNDTTTVDGETLQDVVDAIGEGEAGNTDWAPTYNVTTDDSGNVTGVTVDVPITVTLPTWSNRAKAGKKAQAEWDRFRVALKKHEDGHVKLAKEKLKGVARTMVGKSEADAQTLWDAAVADLRKASDAYDAANDHGRTAGTVIDVDAGAPTAGTGQGTAAPVQPKSIQLQRFPVLTPDSPLIQRAAAYATAPTSPAEDAAFQAVTGKVKGVAKEQKAHQPAKQKADQAAAAAVSPPSETAAKAAANQTDKMAAAQPKPFDKAGFKAALHQKIDDLAPKNLDEMDKFKESGKVQQMQGGLTAQVKVGEKQSAGGVEDTAKEAPSTAGIAPKPVTPLPGDGGGPAPASVDAAAAAPKPKGEAEVSLAEGSHSLDQKMAGAGVTDEQLTKANEPSFQAAGDVKKTAQEDAVRAPQQYRQQEQATLQAARGDAQALTHGQLREMHGVGAQAHGQVHGHQGEAKGKDEEARAKAAADIQAIYDGTKKTVEDRLARLDKEADDAFTQGAKTASDNFENNVKRDMDAYKDQRYSGVSGAALWLEDAFSGLPQEANQIYVRAKARFMQEMDGVLDKVVDVVAAGLTEAKTAIADGKGKVQSYVKDQPAALRKVAAEAASSIQGQFASLEHSVDDKQSQLLDALANKYNEQLKAIDGKIDAMKAENKGLIDQASAAIDGVIQTIKQLKDMLAGVLARAANALDLIIADPIAFLGNLVAGVKQGFMNFVGNIGQHLKAGFMGWLFGAMAEAGITMPESFDLKGILHLVMQVLGLTWANIRQRAVGKLGEKVMKALETGSEIIQKLVNEGPAGLWEWIKDKIGDLKSMVIDQIKGFVIEKVVMAGITWIIGLLNPASAFIKACKAIYDIVMFFVERGSQIMALVNAVIDSVTAIAQGNIAGAANFVEQSLAKAVPVVISFLASLLGVGGISEKIKSVIQQIQEPINQAIDWVIDKAIGLFKAAGKLLGFGGKDKAEDKHGPDSRGDAEKDADIGHAYAKVEPLVKDEAKTPDDVKKALPAIKSEFKLTTLEMKEEPAGEGKEHVSVEGTIQRAPTPVTGTKTLSAVDVGAMEQETVTEIENPSNYGASIAEESKKVEPQTRLSESSASFSEKVLYGQLDKCAGSVSAADIAAARAKIASGMQAARASTNSDEIYGILADIQSSVNAAMKTAGLSVTVKGKKKAVSLNVHHSQEQREHYSTNPATYESRLKVSDSERSKIKQWADQEMQQYKGHLTPSEMKELAKRKADEVIALRKQQKLESKLEDRGMHTGDDVLDEVDMEVLTQQAHQQVHGRRREDEAT